MFKSLLMLTFFLIFAESEASLEKALQLYNGQKAQKNEWITYEMMDAQYYFVASIFAKRHILSKGDHSTGFEETLETIATKAGTESLSDLPDEAMRKVQGATMSLILGLRRFREKNYQAAINSLKDVSVHSRFYPEAQMIIAPAHYFLDPKNKVSIPAYQACAKSAAKMAGQASHEKMKRYYELMSENCLIHVSRMQYKQGQNDQAMQTYEMIDKQSYRWPYLLVERAWASYRLEDFNRALGLVVTYKSPLLESYFFPEAEVLSALSYHALCLYEDSLATIDNFYQNYKPKAEILKKVIAENRRTPDFFLNLVFEEKSEKEKIGPYISGLAIQIRKEVKFNLDLITLRRAEEELKEVEKWPENSLMKYDIINEANAMIQHMKKNMNFYVMERMISFVNEIHKMSFELFNIKLDILSKKRDLIYKGQKLVADGRARGEKKNVRRRSDQHFYEFIGEFWADELGDYSFGLQSNCGTEGKNAAPAVTMSKGARR